MTKANFHMHTHFCDGKNSPEDYVLLALEKGMTAIGFSTHAPVPIENKWNMRIEMLPNYITEIARLKQKYANKIEIYTGFEMDYLITDTKQRIFSYINKADYTIGSVHYLYAAKNKKYCCIDGSVSDVAATFKEFADGDSKLCVNAYYQEIIRIIHEFKPDIIGHLDVIKKQNKNNIYFSEKENWYINLVNKVLDEVAHAGVIIEVNTGGITRGFLTETYPSTWILNEILKRKIPIIISSDAHKAEDIDSYFSETVQKLRALGFTQQKTFCANKWIDVAV